MKISDLAVKHSFYCSSLDYYTEDSWDAFYNNFKNMDSDLNFVFRWDILPDEDNSNQYNLLINIVHQRKGRLSTTEIKNITEKDLPKLISFLKEKWTSMQDLWKPIGTMFDK